MSLEALLQLGVSGAIALGVLGLLARELPKIALWLRSIDRRLARLLERRGIPDSGAPPHDDEDDTQPGRRRAPRRTFLPRLPTAHDDEK